MSLDFYPMLVRIFTMCYGMYKIDVFFFIKVGSENTIQAMVRQYEAKRDEFTYSSENYITELSNCSVRNAFVT